jgi:hypothetical protein
VADGPKPDRAGAEGPGARARFGRFELHELLGKGGYGLVFRAVDMKLGRQVALKLPGPDAVFGPVASASLLREARAAAALSHPNTVRVLEVGQEGPVWFVVMEYCERGSLAQRIAATGPLPPAEAVELVAQLATGIQHAHDRGILHRDLKPSNVLLRADHARPGEGGEPPLVALASDFGLARIEADESLTPAGFPLGTRPYMAPEQARGEVGLIGRSTDVYGLGVVLFEALTGRRPFAADSPEELLARIQNDPAPSVRSLRPAVPRDLDRIVCHCLEKEQADRYPSAAELAVDLQRFLRGDPLLIRRRSWWKRARSVARRHPVAVTAFGIALAGGILVAPLYEVAARRRSADRMELIAGARPGVLDLLLDGTDADDPRIHRAARELLDDPERSRRFRGALTLLRCGEPSAFEPAMHELSGTGPEEVGLLVETLSGLPSPPGREEFTRRLGREGVSPAESLRLAAGLGAMGEGILEPSRPAVAAALAGEEDPRAWSGMLGPSLDGLIPHLEALLRGGAAGPGRALAALLVDHGPGQDLLAELLGEAGDAPRRELLDELVRLRPVAPPSPVLLGLLEGRAGVSRGKASANAAAALIRLDQDGSGRAGWCQLDSEADPATRAFLIRGLGPSGAGPGLLLARLSEGTTPTQAGLLMAMGRISIDDWSRGTLLEGIERVVGLYRLAPDPEVHSASKWLLRRWSAVVPGLDRRIAALDKELAASPPDPRMGWRIMPAAGITLLRVEVPGTGRVVEVSDTEITVAQLRRMMPDHPTSNVLGHDSDNPAYYVDFELAATYCNWLSGLDGVGPEDRPFGRDELGRPIPDLSKLDRRGFRPPTEAEFEALSQAGATGRWHFGDATELLADHAWHTANAASRLHRVGSLLPNRLGLFDTLGNALEWCVGEPERTTNWPRNQVLLGSAYVHTAEQVRAGHRFRMSISYSGMTAVSDPFGFRVVRVCPAAGG